MLQSLHIRHFALIEELHINFGDGLTIFTGETGCLLYTSDAADE